MFTLQTYCGLHLMFLHLVLEHQFSTHHAGCKIVSGMFEIGTYTQVF